MTFMNQAWRRLGAASMAIALLTACGGAGAHGPEVRTTGYGKVTGVNDAAGSGTYYWKGVPFAKPPIGALRWKAPLDPDVWPNGITSAKFGNACVQTGTLSGPGANNTFDATIGTTQGQTVGSEDCLTLNIWRPANGSKNLPVLYFIHGGSSVTGYSADPMYDGAALAKAANVVVVTANYRLNVLGWLDVSQLKTGTSALDDSGNFGNLDMIKVLEFIHKNAANFGGNPGNVTIMGQSAGAVHVYALLVSPRTIGAGLIHRAVALSGGFSLASELPPGSIPTMTAPEVYRAQGNLLVSSLLIADGKATDAAGASAYIASQTKAQIADYLRSKSADTILTTVATKLAPLGLATTGPIPEGTVIPPSAIAAIKAGHYNRVPLLASNTRDEAKLLGDVLGISPALGGKPGFIVREPQLFTMLTTFDPDAVPQPLLIGDLIDPIYLPVATPVAGFTARTDLLNQFFFLASRDSILNALQSQQSNIWYYRFDWDLQPAPWNDAYGATHVIDLPFVFGNFDSGLFSKIVASTANKGGRVALSKVMMSSIGAFARNGDPNHAALGVTWAAWPKQLNFDATLTATHITTH
jgi:para-nitrobenzyl esterase